MAKGGSSGENFQRQGIWLERKSRIRKSPAPAMTWRRRTSRHTPRKNILNSMSSNNVESSPREVVTSKTDDPLIMCMASSTGYSTDTFERDEEQFINDLKQRKTPRKILNNRTEALENSPLPAAGGAKVTSFVFQKRIARIDWRAVHAIDVDRVVREVDIDSLETVLGTIAFGDVQGEDTRNFTEANFVKLFRLAQLMVEYLLHVQELLADHKAELLQAGTTIQQKSEKIRSRFLWQRNTLIQTRQELKQAKKTLKTYEVMLKIQGKTQASQINQSQVRHCPFCEKVFESSYYLDLHVERRHEKTQVTEDKILAVVSKAEEAAAARVKAETSVTVQIEIQQLRERYQADLQRSETASITQVGSLQEDLKQSTNQLHEVQTRLQVLQTQIISGAPNIFQSTRLENLFVVEKNKEKDNEPNQERLYYLESKFVSLENQVKTLGQENSRLLKELNVAYSEVSNLQSVKRKSAFALKNHVEDLRKENQNLKKTMSEVEEEPVALSPFKERQGSYSKELLAQEFGQDQGLLALAHPTSRTRRTEAIKTHYNQEPSEHNSCLEVEHYSNSTSLAKRASCIVSKEEKYEPSLEKMRTSLIQRPNSAAIKKMKPIGDESPTTIEEMREKLEREMGASHAKQNRRQKVVQKLLTKKFEKEKLDERKKGNLTGGKDTRSCKQGTHHPHNKSETPSEIEDEVEKQTTPCEDEKAQKIQDIAEVAAMDVGEEAPTIPILEKQKWLSEHPFVPISNLPHVVAKYPHLQTTFEKLHKKIENEFNGELCKELKKFGISSSTNGISDITYNTISSALEKQRALRMSQIHGNEQKLVEYERGAIVWHTQRAVHDRDMKIIESQFNIASDLGSDHDANASNDSGEESGKSNYNSSKSHQSHKSEDSDCESKDEDSKCTSATAIPVKSSDRGSSESEDDGSGDEVQEPRVGRKHEVVVNHRASHSSAFKGDMQECSGPRSPADGREQHVSRALLWKEKPSSGRAASPGSARPPSPARQSDEGDEGGEVEEELGLGDWDSNEDAAPAKGKPPRRVQIDDRQPVYVSQDSPLRDLSPPKELLGLQQLKSSMASSSYKSTPPSSSPKSSTTPASAQNTCGLHFQKRILDKLSFLEKDETLGNEASMSQDLRGSGEEIMAENNDTDESEDNDVEESKILKELTSEIDEIISL